MYLTGRKANEKADEEEIITTDNELHLPRDSALHLAHFFPVL